MFFCFQRNAARRTECSPFVFFSVGKEQPEQDCTLPTFHAVRRTNGYFIVICVAWQLVTLFPAMQSIDYLKQKRIKYIGIFVILKLYYFVVKFFISFLLLAQSNLPQNVTGLILVHLSQLRTQTNSQAEIEIISLFCVHSH